MGGLAAVIASAVETARAATESLQVDVVHEAWVGEDASGRLYAEPISRKALVQEGAILHSMPDGHTVTLKARLSFVGPMEPNGAEGRQEPIDPRDKITLASGLTGEILELPGAMLNPLTGRPYLSVIGLT